MSDTNATTDNASTDADTNAPATSVAIDSVRRYDSVPTVANGDPYIAHVSETTENGVPTRTVTLTLGTGFTSTDSIARDIQRRLATPDRFEIDDDIPDDFDPERADIFGLHGYVEFDTDTDTDL